MALLLLMVGPFTQPSCVPSSPSTSLGAGEVPRELAPLYEAAAVRYRLGAMGAPVLAAINRIETDFGRNLNTSSAGARGWMQFMPSTWDAYGVDADHDGRRDPFNPADAIVAAARYLAASGAPASWRQAIYAYNHAGWYVADVWSHAQRYAQTATGPADASAPAPPTAQTVAATVFADRHGYRGDVLAGTDTFAELGGYSEHAANLLGGLPYLTALLITNPRTGRSVIARKRDFGFGQGARTLQGYRYRIDIYAPTAARIGLHGSGLVRVQRLDGQLVGADAQVACCAPADTPNADGSSGQPADGLSAAEKLRWPTATRTVSSPFGMRWGRLHAGIDIPVTSDTPIRAAGAGRVTQAGWFGDYGNYVCVQHTLTLSTCYAHQSRVVVSSGAYVAAGQLLGYSGSTGHSTGPHLHFEVRQGPGFRGQPVDPMPYLDGAPSPSADSALGAHDACAVAQAAGPLRERIVQIAQSQLGVSERPAGSNCTPYGPCAAWCAMFTTWVWDRAGIPAVRIPSNYLVSQLRRWAQQRGLWEPAASRPQPGDMVVFSDQHVALVEQVFSSDQLVTINANGGDGRVSRRGPATARSGWSRLGPAPISGYIRPPQPTA
jgi:murein DD-endopeptidase MepM/ murein hydrolase activator NlpD